MIRAKNVVSLWIQRRVTLNMIWQKAKSQSQFRPQPVDDPNPVESGGKEYWNHEGYQENKKEDHEDKKSVGRMNCP